MKKALRVIIPVILVLLVIGSAAWYLFSYDPGFTRDFLLGQARNFEKRGDHGISTWLYSVAYSHSGDSDDIAIELANYYKSIGNYTQAEYTLTSAISDAPTTDLYIALCSTYVEQDKLRDAVVMLDTIPIAAIKAELDSMRPAKPVCSPDAGFYSQNMAVTVSAPTGTIYASNTEDYPSIHNDLYKEPIALPVGESTIYAISIADNNLVSQWTVCGYTLGGVIEEIQFADPAMESAIRTAIGVGDVSKVYTNQLWEVKEFQVPDDATILSDLAHMTKLETLVINNAGSKDLSMLSELKAMQHLQITGGQLSTETLKAIGTLTELKTLTLSNCGLSTVAPLNKLTKLEKLDLTGNTVRNITALSGMSRLTELQMSSNALTDLSALSKLSNLVTLDVSYNALTSISPICGISTIRELNASQNKLSSVSGIEQISSLENLNLSHNSLTEIRSLSGCSALTDLDISYNNIAQIDAVASLKKLINLNFCSNEVAEFPTFGSDCIISSIDASHNLLTSVEPLSKLAMLNTLNVDYNAKLKTLKPLDSCPLLLSVDAYETDVTEAAFLTEKGIVVNYSRIG